MAQIGHVPEALVDRCIIITMQRKTPAEKCERVRRPSEGVSGELRRQCAEFVRERRGELLSLVQVNGGSNGQGVCVAAGLGGSA